MLWFKRIVVYLSGRTMQLAGLMAAGLTVAVLFAPDIEEYRWMVFASLNLPAAVFFLGSVFVSRASRSRGEPDEIARRMLFLPWTTLVAVVVLSPVTAVVVWQSNVASSEIAACEAIIDDQDLTIQKARAARDNADKLTEDIARYEADLEALDEILPKAVDPEAILAWLDIRYRSRGVEICESSVSEEAFDFYSRTSITLALCGSETSRSTAVEHLGDLRHLTGPQLLRIGPPELRGDRVNVVIELFAFVSEPPGSPVDVCDPSNFPDLESWLPPFAGRARSIRSQLEDRCLEIEANRTHVEAVEKLEAKRELLHHKSDIIDALVEYGGAGPGPDDNPRLESILAKLRND